MFRNTLVLASLALALVATAVPAAANPTCAGVDNSTSCIGVWVYIDVCAPQTICGVEFCVGIKNHGSGRCTGVGLP